MALFCFAPFLDKILQLLEDFNGFIKEFQARFKDNGNVRMGLMRSKGCDS